jgi:hypothetical protein
VSARTNASSRLRIVVLGHIVRGPIAGMAWSDLHYVLGLRGLGHDVWFLEDSDDYPSCRSGQEDDRRGPDAGPWFRVGALRTSRLRRPLGLPRRAHRDLARPRGYEDVHARGARRRPPEPRGRQPDPPLARGDPASRPDRQGSRIHAGPQQRIRLPPGGAGCTLTSSPSGRTSDGPQAGFPRTDSTGSRRGIRSGATAGPSTLPLAPAPSRRSCNGRAIRRASTRGSGTASRPTRSPSTSTCRGVSSQCSSSCSGNRMLLAACSVHTAGTSSIRSRRYPIRGRIGATSRAHARNSPSRSGERPSRRCGGNRFLGLAAERRRRRLLLQSRGGRGGD